MNMTGRIWIRRLAGSAVLLLLCGCGAAAPPTPLPADIVEFCNSFQAEAQAAAQADASSDEQPTLGWPTTLPGMTLLAMRPAPQAVTTALLGPPCPGAGDLWAIRADQLRGHVAGIDEPTLAVSAPSLVSFGDGRTAFIAVASEGTYHAANALGIIAAINERRPEAAPLIAMSGAGPWGEAPAFNTPNAQPHGGWHVWSASGDISFGDSEGWAGVTDLAGPMPRDVGRFPTYARHLCMLDDTSEDQCRGGWEYVVTSIVYSPDGQLRLHWRMEEFDQLPSPHWWTPRKTNVRSREIAAAYDLRGGTYQLVEGEAPPNL